MSTLTLDFDTGWVGEKRKEYGNPTRKIEKFVTSLGNVTITKSYAASLSFQIEEALRQSFLDRIMSFIKEEFGEEYPGNIVTVRGDIENLFLPVKGKSEEKEETPKPEAPKPEASKPEAVEPEVSGAKSSDTESSDTESSGAESSGAESSDTESSDTESSNAASSDSETAQESELRSESGKDRKKSFIPVEEELSLQDKLIALAEEINQQIPMKYSRDLANYFDELARILPTMKEMDIDDYFWKHNLLISIRRGYGCQEFLESMVKMICTYLGTEVPTDPSSKIRSHRISKAENIADYTKAWDEIVDIAERMQRSNNRNIDKVILHINISECIKDLSTDMIRNSFRLIHKASTNYLVVLEVASMDIQKLQDISLTLGDTISVKPLMVPQVPMDKMIEYVSTSLNKKGFSLSNSTPELIENLILQDKSDGSFFGYESLDKLTETIIYEKAAYNARQCSRDKILSKEIFSALMNVSDIDEDPMDLLNSLIGVAAIRDRIYEIIAQIKTQKELVDQGKLVDSPSIHMVFTGNPGTGKTTVARIVAKLLRKEGVLSKGQFHEIKGRDLCGRYVGETAPKTTAICRDAYGSVLFIDEAYALFINDSPRDYGPEAITTLLAEMENHRSDMCVILAGYKDEMDMMIKSNPGMKSRIPFEIQFPNYDRKELEEIFFSMMDGTFEYDEAIRDVLKAYLEDISDETLKSKEFANARSIRNLYERCWGKAAYRRLLDNAPSVYITPQDLNCAIEEPEFQAMVKDKAKYSKFGFAN